MNRVRMGMVGGGEGAFIGAVHRHAFALDGQIDLVCGAFSRNVDNNQRTADALGIDETRSYASWQDLLEKELAQPKETRMQALIIVTPNHLHVPISIAAIEAGFHVFCEKPVAMSLAEAKTLAHTLENNTLLFGLAHTYLGYPMVWQAQHMVASGTLGNIRKVFVEYPQGWLSANAESHSKQAAWRTDPAQSGASGCMGDIGTHAFGLVEFVLQQQVTSVCGELQTHVTKRQLDDDGAALIRTSGGASGVLMASQVCAGEENALRIRVYGDKGAIEWQQMEPNSIIHRPLGEPYRVLRAGIDQTSLCEAALARCRTPAGHPEGYLEAMANLYGFFAKAIRENQHNKQSLSKSGKALGVPGINAGLRGMAFIEAMLSSSGSETKWHKVPDSE